jgi:hypothetical protein
MGTIFLKIGEMAKVMAAAMHLEEKRRQQSSKEMQPSLKEIATLMSS